MNILKNIENSNMRAVRDLIPKISENVEVVYKEDKLAALIMTRNTRFAKALVFLFRLPKKITVDLDFLGTRVIGLCDGRNSVLNIAEILSKENDQQIEIMYTRIVKFLEILKSNLYISYFKKMTRN